jgi:hypothetical protein
VRAPEPHRRPGQSYDAVAYHYSLLRTIEDGFGISTYLGSAGAVAPLNTSWQPSRHQ